MSIEYRLILDKLEHQRSAIEDAIDAIRAIGGEDAIPRTEPSSAPKRPGPGTKTGRVWEICDSLMLEHDGAIPTLDAVVQRGIDEGLNAGTINSQYRRWRKHLDEMVPSKNEISLGTTMGGFFVLMVIAMHLIRSLGESGHINLQSIKTGLRMLNTEQALSTFLQGYDEQSAAIMTDGARTYADKMAEMLERG